MSKTAQIADLKARLQVLELQHDNSSWSMGPVYRERIKRLQDQIRELEAS